MTRRRRRVLFWILLPVLLYLAAAVAMWAMQDRLIFVGATWGRGEALPFAPGVRVEAVPLPGTHATFRIATAEPAMVRGVAVFFGGNGEDLRTGVLRAQTFAEYGLECVAVEYPGYGDSGGHPGRRDFFAAADAATDIAAKRARDRGVPLFAIGVSMGTFSAMHLAAEGRVAKALIVSGPTSLEAGARVHYPWLPVSLLLRHHFDSLALAPKTQCPVLVLHGDRDRVVPVEMGEALAKALPKGEWVVAEGYAHDDLPLDVRGPFGPRIAEFLGLR